MSRKYLVITVCLLLGLGQFGFGCNNIQPDGNTDVSNQQKTQNEFNESTKVEETLVSFFDYLNRQEFRKALTLFELDDPANSWEGLENFTPIEDRNDKAKVLKNYCVATGTCLQAKVIEIKKETNDFYNLVVQFKHADGRIFVLGPCCGATEEEMPPQDKFNFKVKKVGNQFKVATAPVYVP